MGLVNKIIERLGTKDESAAFSEDIMFKPHEFFLARIVLDVKKPLLDSVTISISQSKKIKVYIFYEKIAKVCSFCGCLFHSVSTCTQRHQFLLKLNNPKEAANVPLEVYGKWRSQETGIPIEAREVQEDISQNAFVQSFRNYFQNQSTSKNSPYVCSSFLVRPENSGMPTVQHH